MVYRVATPTPDATASASATPAATPPQTNVAFTSVLTSVKLAVTDPWAVTGAFLSDTAKREVVILAGTNDNAVVGWYPALREFPSAARRVLGGVLSSLGTLTDFQVGGPVEVLTAQVEAIPYVVVSRQMPGARGAFSEVVSYVGPVSTLVEGVAALNDCVTIEGKTLFDGFDAQATYAALAAAQLQGDAAHDAALPPFLTTGPHVPETPYATPVLNPVELGTPTPAS